MSQLPVLGADGLPDVCVARSAIDSCSNSRLLSVIGLLSSLVGPAELVSAVKSEKRTLLATSSVPPRHTIERAAVSLLRDRLMYISTPLAASVDRRGGVVLSACHAMNTCTQRTRKTRS